MSPLDDVTVLDVGHLTAGPLTAWLLGSLGAEVVKVEAPGGDRGRTNVSPSEDPPEEGGYYFHSTNTDKRSVAVDVKSDRGREVLVDLAREADVLVENFRPGTTASLGVDYGTLREHNEGLIYCSITGHGHDNRGEGKRAYDSILQALSGIMSATGYRGDPPTKVGVSVIDTLGSYVASVAVLGALCHRRRTGVGQHIDISMQDCAAWLVQSLLPFEPGRTPHRPSAASFRPGGVFEARDGWVLVAVPDPETGARLASMLRDAPDANGSHPETGEESSAGARLEERIAEWAAGRTVEDVVAACGRCGVAAARVADVGDVVADTHLDDRGAFVEVEASGRTMQVPSSPYATALSGGERPERGGPSIGEHTREVLTDVAGYGPDEVDALFEDGAVGAGDRDGDG